VTSTKEKKSTMKQYNNKNKREKEENVQGLIKGVQIERKQELCET
jgi:hypothetical protein